MAGVYIHIPFCDFICYYCDFSKVYIKGQPVDRYIEALLQEIKKTLQLHPQTAIDTIYIGGGTPSCLSVKQLEKLLAGIRRLIPGPQKEFTIECNPNNLRDLDRLRIFKAYGVNRLSIGVQSFDDAVLKKIGRRHTAADARLAIANARKIGFENISIDLIFRLPGQDSADFKQTLTQAMALDLPHYAAYALILEPKTAFDYWQRKGKLHLPSEDAEADMYAFAIDTFEAHGWPQYEVSNFAKPGFMSQHNLIYWHNEAYFGFGAGASGYLEGTRFNNVKAIKPYMAALAQGKLPLASKHLVSFNERIEEELFLGLRTNQGVNLAHFETKFGFSLKTIYGHIPEDLIKKGWLQEKNGALSLTRNGLFFGNDVFEAFLMDDAT